MCDCDLKENNALADLTGLWQTFSRPFFSKRSARRPVCLKADPSIHTATHNISAHLGQNEARRATNVDSGAIFCPIF